MTSSKSQPLHHLSQFGSSERCWQCLGPSIPHHSTGWRWLVRGQIFFLIHLSFHLVWSSRSNLASLNTASLTGLCISVKLEKLHRHQCRGTAVKPVGTKLQGIQQCSDTLRDVSSFKKSQPNSAVALVQSQCCQGKDGPGAAQENSASPCHTSLGASCH